MKIKEVNNPQNAHAVCFQLSFFCSQKCVSLKTPQRNSKPLSSLEAGGMGFLSSYRRGGDFITSCLQRRKEVNSVEGMEWFQLLCCIHIGHFFISITRLKAIAKVPTFISIHPANIKLLRSSLGIYHIPVLYRVLLWPFSSGENI